MTRIAIGFILFSCLAGLVFFVWKDSNDRNEKNKSVVYTNVQPVDMTAVVYAIKDIKEGDKIVAEALEPREVELSKVPVGAITHPAIAIGKKARFGLTAGQLILNSELDPL